MRTTTPLVLIVALSLTGCTTMVGADGKEHSVIDTERVEAATAAVSVAANAMLPGAGLIVQGVGALIALIGGLDRRKKLGTA